MISAVARSKPAREKLMNQQKYTFVTVAHEADWNMLGLQARSMGVHLPNDLVGEIILIDNSRPGWTADFRDRLHRSYGKLADKVRLLAAAEVADVTHVSNGWFSQQVLKVMISEQISTDRYVVLDAKNHLVLPLQRGFLEAGSKIRSALTNYQMHSLRQYFEKTLQYFGLNPAQYMHAFMPSVTPFTMPTEMVREMSRYIAKREGKPFPAAFLDLGIIEFLTFASFISMLGRMEEIYDFSGLQCPIVRPDHVIRGAGNVKRHIMRGEKNALPFFAVHRGVPEWLDSRSRRVIAEFWYRHGLFDTVADGLKFLSSTAPIRQPARRFYLRWKSRYRGLVSRIRRCHAEIRF